MIDISLEEFQKAEEMLKPLIHRTETMASRSFSDLVNAKVYLKCENLQKTASFKIRGATYKIKKLQNEGKLNNVVTASAGNHAQGVARAAQHSGVRATIFMPEKTPLMKIDATESYGAKVVISGSCFDEAYEGALKFKEETGDCFIHPYDDLDVITGQGTVGLEIMEDCPDADVILVPAGGGGLLSGVATAVKKINPKVQVIGVQSEKANALVRSFRQKQHLISESSDTIADGIAVRNPGRQCLELILRNADDMLEVSDEDISIAILTMVERAKLIVEPAGASSIAAMFKYKERFEGKKVVCVLSGGNADTCKIHRYLEMGLIKTDRWLHFKVIAPTNENSTYQIIQFLINQCQAAPMDIGVDRYMLTNANEIAINITCEVRNTLHKQEVLKTLGEHYRIIAF